MWQIIEGDALDVLRGMADASVEAVVCDPPYELGFMGKHWDAAGIANNVEMWREVLRILKPGGHLFAFGGTRTYHRMTCAIEDAGFEIRDCVQWLYGSGFPKSHDIGKAIDKAAGAEREVVGIKPDPRYQYASKTPVFSSERRGYDDGTTAGVFSAGLSDASALTAPATPAAQQWDGWGTALKPAHEPIVLARKPIVGTVAANVQTYGTGALNIAAARVGTEEDVTRISGPHIGWGLRPGQRSEQPTGRWPANLVLSHAPGCVKVGTKRVKVDTGNTRHKLGADYNGKRGSTPNAPSSSLPTSAYADADGLETVDAWECVEGCPVRALGEQSGERHSGGHPAAGGQRSHVATYGTPNRRGEPAFGASTGTAARFFTNLEPSPLDDVTPWLYTAKASRREREAGLEGMEERPAPTMSGGEFRNPLWDGARSNKEITARNPHPTVKPVALMRWLVKLITPPGGIVLDPFAGSGTTGIACVLDGFGFIGIEQDADYCEIARRRIAHWEREAMLTQPALLDMTGD